MDVWSVTRHHINHLCQPSLLSAEGLNIFLWLGISGFPFPMTLGASNLLISRRSTGNLHCNMVLIRNCTQTNARTAVVL